MIDFPDIQDLCQPTPTKIVMLVVDGLGGLPNPDTGKSELETATLPHLDQLARESACGLTTPVVPGITPGSGPGHMALFGYDPVKYLLGRGVIEALGIGVELENTNVAARGNLCTINDKGVLVDRRANRIPSKDSRPIVEALDRITLHGVDLSVYLVHDYRFVLVIRGENLNSNITETDPQGLGKVPLEARSLIENSSVTAKIVNNFVYEARKLLDGRETANMVLLRGFSSTPTLPQMGKTYGLKTAAIAAYPMYRGLAKLLGMTILPTGPTFKNELDTLSEHFADHNFFFLHYKPADAAGEDGNFESKVAALEELDTYIPRLMDMGAHTLIVGGDHSTPSIMGSHSWHPVPFMIRSHLTKGEAVSEFSEKAFHDGSIGLIPATSVMMLALAHSGKLKKFGP